jgi:hypothetical protein
LDGQELRDVMLLVALYASVSIEDQPRLAGPLGMLFEHYAR